ncbi:hypothetical protein D039_3107B, partial [Vibrio parahaemolyticus EKP-028]
CGH